MQIHAINFIKGFAFGLQYETIDEDEYLIVSLCIVEIILVY